MEQQMDTLKVHKHYQHERLQNKEEQWISSEDLRTDGSSDEETQDKNRIHKSGKKNKTANSTSSVSKDIFSLTPKFSDFSNAMVFTKETSGSSSKSASCLDKSATENNTDNFTDEKPLTGSLLPDIFLDSAQGASGITLRSSDADVDALNLESRWRPKRGSLKYPMLVEGQTTENYIHEINGFYNEMMGKLKLLKNCSVIRNLRQNEKFSLSDDKSFKHLKHTPEVKKKLEYIDQLDEEIKETIQNYKSERSERLQTQDEMCNEIYNNKKYLERNAQMFLEMCRFEASDEENNEKVEGPKDDENKAARANCHQNSDFANNFIKRNIELAKEGAMAGCSLTDEEKKTLEDLLSDVDGPLCDEEAAKLKQYEITNKFPIEEEDDSDTENCYTNAYVINEDNKKRMEDIDSELEKFKLDEIDKEKEDLTSTKYRHGDWRDALLDRRLKNIDAQLNDLHVSYGKDVDTLEASDATIVNTTAAFESSESEKLQRLTVVGLENSLNEPVEKIVENVNS